MEKEENSKKNDPKVKKNEKETSSFISEKILDYKSKLDAIPIQLISVDQSEQDREEVNELYTGIESTATQLLDSKFYTQIVKMNRERDKNYLKEGTTRKERISILAQIISRVTTPIVFLNHKRNIHLSNFYLLDINEKESKNKDKEEKTYTDPINNIKLPDELTQADINALKSIVMKKTQNISWNMKVNSRLPLSDWEADILSQLIRDEELSIQVDKKTGKVKIVSKKRKSEKSNTIAFLFEPEKSE